MKQVIFIGGASYSGTTFLELTLGNDKHGFSCGEVRDYYHPTKKHHVNACCSCGDKECSIWKMLKINGEENLYENIFNRFPEVNFITDSSKDPFWIAKHNKILESKGIKTTNIIIWKSPEEIATSYYKRGRLKEWHIRWISYHRLYCTLINNWRSVRCNDFVNDAVTLEKICNYADIPFFREKHNYQEMKSHILFGNNSAKIELYKKESDVHGKMKSELEFKQKGLKNLSDDLAQLQGHIKKIRDNYCVVNEIEEVLELRNILNYKAGFESEKNIKMNTLEQLWKASKRRVRFELGKLKYEY